MPPSWTTRKPASVDFVDKSKYYKLEHVFVYGDYSLRPTIPIKVTLKPEKDGMPCYVQVDTGTDRPIFRRSTSTSLGVELTRGKPINFFTLAGPLLAYEHEVYLFLNGEEPFKVTAAFCETDSQSLFRWTCITCGFICYTRDLLESCPKCKAPREKLREGREEVRIPELIGGRQFFDHFDFLMRQKTFCCCHLLVRYSISYPISYTI